MTDVCLVKKKKCQKSNFEWNASSFISIKEQYVESDKLRKMLISHVRATTGTMVEKLDIREGGNDIHDMNQD